MPCAEETNFPSPKKKCEEKTFASIIRLEEEEEKKNTGKRRRKMGRSRAMMNCLQQRQQRCYYGAIFACNFSKGVQTSVGWLLAGSAERKFGTGTHKSSFDGHGNAFVG